MGRKKVETKVPVESAPKKREENSEKTGPIKYSSNDTKVKWDKVKGVKGKVVRYKEGEESKRREELHKQNYRQLYVAVDGGNLYFYYEILD